MCFLPLSFILFYPIPNLCISFWMFSFPLCCEINLCCEQDLFAWWDSAFLLFSDALYWTVLSSETSFCMGAVLEISFHCALGRDHEDCSTVGLKFMRVSQWCRMGNWGCKLSWMKLQTPVCVSVTHISVLYLEDCYLTSLLPSAFLSELQFSPSRGLRTPVLPVLKGDSRCRSAVATMIISNCLIVFHCNPYFTWREQLCLGTELMARTENLTSSKNQ